NCSAKTRRKTVCKETENYISAADSLLCKYKHSFFRAIGESGHQSMLGQRFLQEDFLLGRFPINADQQKIMIMNGFVLDRFEGKLPVPLSAYVGFSRIITNFWIADKNRAIACVMG